jgi:hypothetical protein
MRDAGRLRSDELFATVEGDRHLADLVLAGLDSFARDRRVPTPR